MTLHLLELSNTPILKQLQIEEYLMRTDNRNWCIINHGSDPSIVMGISGKPEELIALDQARNANVALIKRFSGGGTVIVDENTLFVTFIFQKETHPFSFPEPIMRFTEDIYRAAFPIPNFSLRENDYVIAEKKCGGNAQYIKKNCWLHHTSFLWDYQPARMDLLLHPKKTPQYREGRNHHDFLTCLKDHTNHPQTLIHSLKTTLAKRYNLIEATIPDLSLPHRQETCLF